MKSTQKPSKLHFLFNPARPWPGILAALLLAGFVHQAAAQSYSLSTAWTAANGTGHLANNNANRGIAFSALSNIVFVSTRAGTATGSIDVFNAANGALLSGTGGVTGANLGIDQVGVGDDGILYGAPLSTTASSGSPFQLYSWTNWNNSPYLAYQSTNSADPLFTFSGTKRVGDTLAVTGAGTNTLILATVAAGCTNFLLLHTVDGSNFTSTLVEVPVPSTGGNILGITFYTNNSFLVQPGSGASSRNVYLVSFPTNFASQSTVTGTILGSAAALSSSVDEFLNYSPVGQMLAVVQTLTAASTNCAVDLFSTTNFPASANQLSATTFATPNANGNATGGAALGGQGKTNSLYVLQSDNGVEAFNINFTPGAIAPVVSALTGGITNAYPPQTLAVNVTGTAPLHYQWYVISGGTTNAIAGATTNAYTAAAPVTNTYFVVVTNNASSGNVITSSVVGLSLLTPVTNAVVSQLWSAAIGAYGFLANDDDTRGIAYDTNLNVVLVATTSGGVGLELLNGATGASIGTLSSTGLPNDNQFVIDQVGIADDGVVYGGCLDIGTSSSQYYTLNQWPAASNGAVAVQAYGPNDPGNGSNDRWGDTMAVRGAGSNTQVLLGSSASANVVLFTTPDGISFNPTLMTISGAPAGFAAKGVAFGAGNTFWAKNYGGNLFEIAFDPVELTNAILENYSISGQIPSRMVALGVDPVHNILAGVDLLDINNDLQLYQLTGTANPPVLFDQAFFPSYNANGNVNAAIVMKYPRVYALDVNNGIVALQYGLPATTAPTISSDPVGATIYSTDPSVVLTVGVSGSLPIYYQWQENGTNIPNATNSTYTLNRLSTNSSGSYDVVINNIGGTLTSSPPAVLTVYTPVTSTHVSQIWSVAANGTNAPYQSLNTGLNGALTNYPFIDATSYNARGLAYDTNTSTVLVSGVGATAYLGIYVLDADTGTNEFALDTTALPTANTLFPLNQIGAGDDGVIYAGNCVAAGSGSSFALYSWSSVNASVYPYSAFTGDPGNGSGDRWGDSMAVRGAGTNTQILLGTYVGYDSGPATNAALLTTTDGQIFTSTLLTITNADITIPPGFSMLGIAFGASNTFWTQSYGYDLREFAFDPVTGNCSLLQNISNATSAESVFASVGAIGYDATNNILAGIAFGDTPMDVALYQISSGGTPPYLLDQAFFPAVNANGQRNGATVIKYPRIYSLDVNNGLVALTYSAPAAAPVLSPFNMTSVREIPGTGVVLTWQSLPEFTYQVQVASTLSGSAVWSNLGAPIVATGTTTSYTDTSANASLVTGFYRVVGK
jgi:hypothetical protein